MPDLAFGADRLAQQIAFLVEVDKLKEVFRQTRLTQSRRHENDAEHSWHLCLAVILLAEHADAAQLDVLRVLKMVILHDLVEIDAGDTFAYDEAGMADQHERECRAADRIFGLLPESQSAEFRALWDEFEAGETAESRFARACDRFQPMLLNLMTDGASWREHGITLDRVRARNQHIAAGSRTLWERMEDLLEQATQAGIIARGPADA
jgi:putative hydrolase of HD superfamily